MAEKPTRQLAVWTHSNSIWNALRSRADEDGIYRGNLSELFHELDCAPHRHKVMKALKLMGRIELLKRSSGYGEVSETLLLLPEAELSVDEFNRVVDEVYGTTQHRKQTKKWITEQRIDDLATQNQRLLAQLDALQSEVEHLTKRVDLLEERVN